MGRYCEVFRIDKGVNLLVLLQRTHYEYELVQLVRSIETLDGGIPVYKNAEIRISREYPEFLYPSAKYVLRSNLETVSYLRSKYLRQGVDILKLDGLYSDGKTVISPPIVEWSDNCWVIVDGLHRLWLARYENLGRVNVLKIRGSNPDYPIISYPVVWREVAEYAQKPEKPHLLRNIRNDIKDESESLRRYYRDFSVLGSSGRRPRAIQKG